MDGPGDVGWDTSIALDSSGKAHISYYDADSGNLKYAANTSGSWVSSVVDSTGDVGWDTSIALDSTGQVHISYYDATNSDLKHASGSPGAWVVETVDSAGDTGVNTALYIDSSNTIRIAYHNYTDGMLKYASNMSGAWMTETADSSGDVGGFVSIKGDSAGDLHISYYDQTHGDLRHAIKKKADNLKKGFNFISAPTSAAYVKTAHALLNAIPGREASVKKVIRYDKASGFAREATFNPDGTIGGADFPIATEEGIIVYALKDTAYEMPNDVCPVFSLTAGGNWVGTPCIPTHATAFSMIGAIGSDKAISIQRFNTVTGRFETAGYRNGSTVGVDFPIEPGQGYFIYINGSLSGFIP